MTYRSYLYLDLYLDPKKRDLKNKKRDQIINDLMELVLLALLALIQPLQAKDWPKEPLADVQQAAERGDADAQFSLGFRYDNGLGVPQDAAQAVVWYRKAAEQGNAGAQFALGAMYATGQGTPQDYQQAYAWSSVADLGHMNRSYRPHETLT